jgi:hypothetical protein
MQSRGSDRFSISALSRGVETRTGDPACEQFSGVGRLVLPDSLVRSR